jgi:hypothetical protein
LYRSIWLVKEFWVLQYPDQNNVSTLSRFIINYDKIKEIYANDLKIIPKNIQEEFLS